MPSPCYGEPYIHRRIPIYVWLPRGSFLAGKPHGTTTHQIMSLRRTRVFVMSTRQDIKKVRRSVEETRHDISETVEKTSNVLSDASEGRRSTEPNHRPGRRNREQLTQTSENIGDRLQPINLIKNYPIYAISVSALPGFVMGRVNPQRILSNPRRGPFAGQLKFFRPDSSVFTRLTPAARGRIYMRGGSGAGFDSASSIRMNKAKPPRWHINCHVYLRS